MQVTAAVLVNAKLLAGSPLSRLGSAEPPGQQFFMGEFHGPFLEVPTKLRIRAVSPTSPSTIISRVLIKSTASACLLLASSIDSSISQEFSVNDF